MRKLFTLIAAVFATSALWAQIPQTMSYQAVIRNSSDQLVTNQAIGMRISILQGFHEGSSVYVETHSPTTNANGLVTIEIGGGTPVTGTFAEIDWSTGLYFIKTETDPNGGTNYTITGTSQLLSVPYALYAQTSGNAFSGNYDDLSNKPVFFNGSWANVTGKPTTIAGYGITDAFDGTWTSLAAKPTTISGYGITDAVTNTGDQIIAGNKTFNGTTTVGTPVNPADAANKAYVDASSGYSVSKTGDTLYLGNNRFVIIPNISASNPAGLGKIPVIPDISWSKVTVGADVDFTGWIYVAFGNNTFIAVTDNGCGSLNNSSYKSSDFGENWIKKATPGATDISGVAFSQINNHFVISHRCYEFDRNYSYSTNNGDTWTPVKHSPETYRYYLLRVKDYFFSNLYNNSCDRSSDGVNWTQLTFGGSKTTSVMTYSEKFNLYYANDGDDFWTSPDATDWTKRDTLGKYQFIAGNSVVLAYRIYTNKPLLKQSTDGLTFQKLNTLPDVSYIYRMKFLNGLFWAVISVTGDDTKKVMVSSDGTNWKIINTPEIAGLANDIEIGYDSVQKKNIIIVPCAGGVFLKGVYNAD